MPVIFFVSFPGMEEGRYQQAGEKMGNTKSLGGYSKDDFGSCRAQGPQCLDEGKSRDHWEIRLFLCFAGS